MIGLVSCEDQRPRANGRAAQAASVFVPSQRRAGALLGVINVHASTLSYVNPECMCCIFIACTDGRGSFCSSSCFRYRLNATDLTLPAHRASSSGPAAASAVGMC